MISFIANTMTSTFQRKKYLKWKTDFLKEHNTNDLSILGPLPIIDKDFPWFNEEYLQYDAKENDLNFFLITPKLIQNEQELNEIISKTFSQLFNTRTSDTALLYLRKDGIISFDEETHNKIMDFINRNSKINPEVTIYYSLDVLF